MALKINQPEVEQLLHELVDYTGETTTQVLIKALRDLLVREKAKRQRMRSLQEELLRIGRECAALPVLDHRTPEEILGYDAYGMPT